jgi:hypothetical protein
MGLIDERHTRHPFYGSGRLTAGGAVDEREGSKPFAASLGLLLMSAPTDSVQTVALFSGVVHFAPFVLNKLVGLFRSNLLSFVLPPP